MRLTVLGCDGPYPREGGACSSYLVEGERAQILLDMGSGSLAHLQRYASIKELDAICLSHLHYDHMADIFLLKYAFGLYGARGEAFKRPTLFMPKTPKPLFQEIAAGDYFHVVAVEDGYKAEVEGLSLTFTALPHPVENYGVWVEEGDKRLAYTGDTTVSPRLEAFSKDASLFLVDGGLLERHKTPTAPHLTVGEASSLGRGAKRTLITHLFPGYTREELERECLPSAEFVALDRQYEIGK